MVVRNEDKFRTRNKSRRSVIETALFRPETVAMMAAARDRLSFATAGTDFLDLKTMKRTASATDTTISLHSDASIRVICDDASRRATSNNPSTNTIPNNPSANSIPNNPSTTTVQKDIYLEGDVGDGEQINQRSTDWGRTSSRRRVAAAAWRRTVS